MRFTPVSAFCTLAIVALACASSLDSHAADPPRRVVSFNICADQLVVALADPEQIAALSPYATDPALSTVAEKARAFPRTGWTAETIVPLNPDLVLVGTWDRSLTQRLLRGLGFRLEAVELVGDIDGALAQIGEIAAILGHRDRGMTLASAITAERRRLRDAVRKPAPSALLIGHGGFAEGTASLASALLAEAGFARPAGAPGGYGGFIPLEKLFVLRPDYLVIASQVDDPDSQGALYLSHPALKALYPPERRIVLPSRYTLCGGPSLLAALNYLSDIVMHFRPASPER